MELALQIRDNASAGRILVYTNSFAILRQILIFKSKGIHAREWISPATASYLAKQLSEKKSALLAAFDVYILPLANPDG